MERQNRKYYILARLLLIRLAKVAKEMKTMIKINRHDRTSKTETGTRNESLGPLRALASIEEGMKMRLRTAIVSLSLALAAAGLYSIPGPASAQESQIPFYAEQPAWPNVMFFLDNSGNMSQTTKGDLEKRKMYQIVRDVIAGSGNMITVVDGSGVERPVYIGHSEGHFDSQLKQTIYEGYGFEERNVLYNIQDALIKIIRIEWYAAGGYWQPSPTGDYFTPYSADYDAIVDPIFTASIDTLDSYLRLKNADYVHMIHYNAGINLFDGAFNGPIFQPSLYDFNLEQQGLLFDYGTSVSLMVNYAERGRLSIPGQFMVAVYPVSADDTAIWTSQSDGLNKDGLCWVDKNTFMPCYKPERLSHPSTSVDMFMSLDDIPDWQLSEELLDAAMPFWEWMLKYQAGHGYPPVGYKVLTTSEVWGDRPYAEWSFSNKNEPESDGNTPTMREILVSCNDLTDSSCIPVMPDADYVRNRMLERMPRVTPLASDSVFEPESGEFIFDDAGSIRLDKYVRDGIVSDSSLDPFDKNFGGFFDGLSYDLIFEVEPSIMDYYPEINYGFMQFSKDKDCTGADDDFPEDSDGVCIGGDLLFNPSSWASFPAYQYLYPGITASKINKGVQDYLRLWGSHTNEIRGTAPIGSNLHDFYRYFYHPVVPATDPVYPYSEPSFVDSVDPSMYYDLRMSHEWNGTIVENDHIIQDDPYYEEGCRRNFLIYLSGGQQTGGEEKLSTAQNQHDKVVEMEMHWVQMLKYPPHKGGWGASVADMEQYGVKMFLIGFGADAVNKISESEFTNMGTATKMGPDDPYDTYLVATNEVELRETLSEILDYILKGQFARAAPVVSVRSDVILTTYFDIGLRKLWSGHLLGWSQPDPVNPSVEPKWGTESDIANILNARATSRNVFTALSSNMTMIDFDATNANLFETSEYFLKYASENAEWGNTLGEEVIGVARGDFGATFSDGDPVDWAFGPTFHSEPVVVRPPNNIAYAYDQDYLDFAEAYKNRPDMIFIGTGFGMLHAFNLADGEEMFAFVPEPVLQYLPFLWVGTQVYGVDATSVVEDVKGDFDGVAGNDDTWRTVLMSGLGGGGTAYFALDVTDAHTTTSSSDIKPLWYFRHPNLGETWSEPVIGKIRYEENPSTIEQRFVAFFGGGVNPDPTNATNVGGYFYMLDVVDGQTLLVRELYDAVQVPDADDIDSPSTAENTNEAPGDPNVIDVDGDGYLDRAYIGDNEGRVWKVDFTDPDPSNWEYCIFYDISDLDHNEESDGDIYRKPVWYTPTLARGPDGSILAYFSSSHVEINDVALDESDVNHLFAVADTDLPGQCTYAAKLSDVYSGVVPEDAWPKALESGEKLMDSPIVTDKKLIFKTFVPTSTKACSVGAVRLWAIDYLTGDAVWDWDGDGEADEYDDTKDYSHSDITMDPSGKIIETCTSEECLGEYEEIAETGGNRARPMSWAEGWMP